MREPYGEGPASHTGPESCVRDGNVHTGGAATPRGIVRRRGVTDPAHAGRRGQVYIIHFSAP